MAKIRPYLYYDHVSTLCTECLRQVEGKYTIHDDNTVWLYKWCPAHGQSKVLIATDAKYWRDSREVYVKKPEMPLNFNTEQKWGCPYDCGLCPDHMQHSCLTILEVTDYCNLSCPVCYADSSPAAKNKHRSLDIIEKMLDAIVKNEGEPDVVQLSGGEPTEHPDFFKIMDLAKARPIRHLMLNTNGVKIANDLAFVEELSKYSKGFEVYLQFDSFESNTLLKLRGVDLTSVRTRALENLNKFGISTTLVSTLAKGLNDHEIGKTIEYAQTIDCVRGVTFQPVELAGRIPKQIKGARLTLTEVRQKILEQSSLFVPEDIIPVPCNPDALAMAYAIKTPLGVMPLTRFIEPEVLIDAARNTIVFEADTGLKEKIFSTFSTGHGPEDQASCLSDMLCCLPQVQAPKELTYKNVFRVLIMSFMDANNFDTRAMKKSCVHIVQPDGRIIPFESFNLLYRSADQRKILEERRSEVEVKFFGKKL